MNLEDKLDIILITYNRKKLLERTFEQIFAVDSPIRNFPITILDNKSDDGTIELIQDYKRRFPNIIHIVNRRNIGGNANIVRAFEMVERKYFWILCDDDIFDWTYWNEIEDAIAQDKDVILTEHLTEGSDLPIEVIVNELNFLPAGIYKSEIISGYVIQNAYANIYNSFPHQALVAEAVNTNRTFFVPEHTVLIQNLDKGENCGYKRGFRNNVHFRIAHFNLLTGMVNSYQMINDKKIRQKCCGCLYLGRTFYRSMRFMLRTSGLYRYNICDVFNGISWNKRIVFMFTLCLYLISPIIDFTFTNKGLYANFFRCVKTKILPRKCFFWIK